MVQLFEDFFGRSVERNQMTRTMTRQIYGVSFQNLSINAGCHFLSGYFDAKNYSIFTWPLSTSLFKTVSNTSQTPKCAHPNSEKCSRKSMRFWKWSMMRLCTYTMNFINPFGVYNPLREANCCFTLCSHCSSTYYTCTCIISAKISFTFLNFYYNSSNKYM